MCTGAARAVAQGPRGRQPLGAVRASHFGRKLRTENDTKGQENRGNERQGLRPGHREQHQPPGLRLVIPPKQEARKERRWPPSPTAFWGERSRSQCGSGR